MKSSKAKVLRQQLQHKPTDERKYVFSDVKKLYRDVTGKVREVVRRTFKNDPESPRGQYLAAKKEAQ